MAYKIIERRNRKSEVVGTEATIETAIETALDIAEDNGYIPDVESREDLSSRLKEDKEYDDGDVTTLIRFE